MICAKDIKDVHSKEELQKVVDAYKKGECSEIAYKIAEIRLKKL